MIDADVKKEIQTAYSNFLKSKDLRPRHGQKLMIAEIAKMLGGVRSDTSGQRIDESHLALIEAGTGTGKTIAYLMAVLPIAKRLDKKVVLATATVALQEQIVFKDIPDLIVHSSMPVNFALAKGRGRYVCLTKLERLLSDARDLAPVLYEDEVATVSPVELELYREMMLKQDDNTWDGDRDNWEDIIDDSSWRRVTTDHRQCTGRKCPHIRSCAFYESRGRLDDVDCIVANHDLVLADLALGGGAILPAPEETIYIFDEAHHLPDKALQHFSLRTRYKSTLRWLGQIEGQWEKLKNTLLDASYLQQIAQPFPDCAREARVMLDKHLGLFESYVDQMDMNERNVRHRFPLGEVSTSVEMAAEEIALSFTRLQAILSRMLKELESLVNDEVDYLPKPVMDSALQTLGPWLGRVEASMGLWSSYIKTSYVESAPMARWMTLLSEQDQIDIELVSSPVLASGLLQQQLWERCFASVLTSATLTALRSFDRFVQHAGVGESAVCLAVPSPFDYANKATLTIPKLAVEANRVSEHTESLVSLLPDLLNLDEGTLILFSSYAQLNSVFSMMPVEIESISLVQGNRSKQKLLSDHKSAIDSGKGSILWGVASFSEGVDLPGDYCKHVIIAKLPFSVPDEPLESALAEWIEARGGNAFMEISVPDASLKLIQSCGRLLRKESDEGRITILDRRLLTKSYGRSLLNSLPPFRQVL
ncbi:MAG: ATP-dependent DNA helicase DinG [Flavobacteriales bacterium]|jgi:ATP-dependent DNA helicase DinG